MLERMVKKMVKGTLVIVLGLLIVNKANGFTIQGMFASEEDFKRSADVIATYIVTEYQKNDGKYDIDNLYQKARELDKYGLQIVKGKDDLGRDEISIVYNKDPKPQILKTITLD